MIFESLKPMPYVYICTHKVTGQFYIGSRTSSTIKRPSHIDLPIYRTSSKIVKPNFEEYDWIIVAEFFSANDALTFEQELIFENWGNPLILNQSCHINHSLHWSVTGRKHTNEAKRRMSENASKRRWSDTHKAKIGEAQKGKPKPCKRVDKFFWYNDGIENKLFSDTATIPPGFLKGRLMPRNKNNTNNKGKSWFYDGEKRVYETK